MTRLRLERVSNLLLVTVSKWCLEGLSTGTKTHSVSLSQPLPCYPTSENQVGARSENTLIECFLILFLMSLKCQLFKVELCCVVLFLGRKLKLREVK